MSLSYEYINFLNEKVLEYLPSNRVTVGNKINFRCPICGDSNKSATKKRGWWYNETASFYCWNCSTSLSGIKFIEVVSGKDYEEIKTEFIKLFLKSGKDSNLSSFVEKHTEEEPSLFNLKSIIKPEWKQPLTNDAIEYLKARKVLDAPFLEDRLYSYTKNDKDYILIPWVLNGVDAYFQVNDFKKHGSIKYIFPKNKHKLIYGLDNIDLSWPYIIVFEGVYDSLFVKNAIAVGTKAITDYQMSLIKERYPKMTICCSFDNDMAGISSMVKLIKKNTEMKFFKWFNKNTKQKDINEYVLYKNDVNIFSDKNKLEKMIIDPLQMKWDLIQNGLWIEEKSKNILKKASAIKQQNPFEKFMKSNF